MDILIEFARGPLFRFSIIVLVLGLARLLILDLYSAYRAYQRAGDKTLPWKLIISRSIEWLIPIKRIGHNRPIYSIISVIFHIGLLIVPICLYAHVELWKSGIGLSWPTLPYNWAYWLTLVAIVSGLFLFFGRVFSGSSSYISRKQDFLWPLLLLVPFATGFVCAHLNPAPGVYQIFMLMHILAGDLIFILIPFTKIAHCVLMPLSQFICNLAWKFPADTDDDICTTLNKKGAPV